MATQDLAPRSMLLEEFTPLVGQTLLADCSPRPVALTLIKASPLLDADSADRPPFSLIFHTAPETLLVSGLYTMRCGDFGPALIYITPVMRPRRALDGYYYEAVFN